MSKTVYLCPSNQWANSYAYAGTNEGTQMNIVADLVTKILNAYEVSVQRSDNGLDYKRHCEVINNIMPDVCVFIHSNAFNNSVTGTETLYSPAVKGSKEFAQLLQNKVVAVRPSKNRGIYNGTYPLGRNVGYMNRTKCVSALVELEYHDECFSAEFIINHKNEYAYAIAMAIVEWLNLKPIVVNTPAPVVPADTYKILPGDTLSKIARQFGTTVEILVSLNGIVDKNTIIAGQTLRLPGAAQPAPAPAPTPAPAPQPALKSIDEIAREVIRGNWGNGQTRVNKLTAAGHNPVAVQKRVNELLKK